ncbi:MAG: flavin reductase family protein [Ornithinimicrobium sp.]|jgi:flavin reductase (DIM6/NTAB) family NADH-FMN oxidoreductase RutF|uniref:flavin reductase family protein n=1 Tax=Ornithinimicrobium sp. TaxID=1977084 RepID=UPI001832B90C|nr:flavin reductase [Actinomycetota bacterium]
MTTDPPAPSEADETAYRRAIGRFATGVVVASTLAGPHDHAMTANSLTSVSLDPLLMVLSVAQEARWHEAVAESGVWGISVLPATSRGLADWFATPGRPLHGQLDRVPHHRGNSGVALLDGALATLECRTVAMHPAGDHSLVVGAVLHAVSAETAGPALVHFRGTYSALP